jgi:hypothetical protein
MAEHQLERNAVWISVTPTSEINQALEEHPWLDVSTLVGKNQRYLRHCQISQVSKMSQTK